MFRQLWLLVACACIFVASSPSPEDILKSDASLSDKVHLLRQEKATAVASEDYTKAEHIKTMIETIQLMPGGEHVADASPGGAKKAVKTALTASGLEFMPAFLASVSMILVSELGDKTFFIAAIMAMRHSRMLVFTAAISALIVMTILSAALGFALPNIMPRRYTHYAAAGLFLFFGIKLLKDAAGMEAGASEELGEVEEELEAKKSEASSSSMEEGGTGKDKAKSVLSMFFSPIFIQCFTLTFLAEWGDRSQIATIALAAAKDPVGVTLGGIIGHSCCTGLAVVGGKLLASSISERSVILCGGVLFLLFAAHSIFVGPEGDM